MAADQRVRPHRGQRRRPDPPRRPAGGQPRRRHPLLPLHLASHQQVARHPAPPTV